MPIRLKLGSKISILELVLNWQILVKYFMLKIMH